MGRLCFLSFFTAMILTSQAQFFLPITKDETTKQFYTTLEIGTTLKTPLNLLLDLGTNLTWLNCHKLQSLKSLHTVACDSLSCQDIPGNGCDGNSCLYQQPNPLINQNVTGRVVQDSASFYPQLSLRIFTFSCVGDNDLKGLPPAVAGVLSLSPGSSSFTKQVTSEFGLISKLSLCLPSHGTGHFYVADNSTSPIPKTLTIMAIQPDGYLIPVQSINVDGTRFEMDILAKVSTVVPYTVLVTGLYNFLAQSFTLKAEAMGISKVSPVAPFKDCFDARNVAGNDMTGPNVPEIEIGLLGKTDKEVMWILHGANTMVKVSDMVMCLAFYDGGEDMKESIVFGTHQLQDYMLEFDISSSTFGFSDSLLLHNTTCSTWPS